MTRQIWRPVKPPVIQILNDDDFWKLHEKMMTNKSPETSKGETTMPETQFNPLIPGEYEEIEDKSYSSDNPLIPGYRNSGRKQFAAAATSKKGATGSSTRRLLSAPDSAQLAQINQLSKRDMAADELLVGQMRLANNCIDRDRERFSEEVLQGFADTVVRKTLLLDHDTNVNRSAIGKFFAVEVEKMTLANAIAQTGEALQLAPGITEVQFLAPWFYLPKKGISEQDLARLESGIFDFVSIGFSAEKLVPITDGQGATLFHEFQGKGEVREGSIVYLGAQRGAAIKSATTRTPQSVPSSTSNDNPLIVN